MKRLIDYFTNLQLTEEEKEDEEMVRHHSYQIRLLQAIVFLLVLILVLALGMVMAGNPV